MAFSFASGDSIRIWTEAWLTPALWVPISICRAGGSWPTRRWVARIRRSLPSTYRKMSWSTTKTVMQDNWRSGITAWRTATIHRTLLWNVSSNTRANSISLVVNYTVGKLSTWGRMTSRSGILKIPVVAGSS